MNTVNKVYGGSCVFDKPLFFQSDKQLGWDFCRGHEVKGTHQSHAWKGGEYSGNSFPGGFYVFEDNFDDWYNMSMYKMNTKYLFNDKDSPKSWMKSARWFQMMNTKASDNCGSYSDPHPDMTMGHTRTLHSPDHATGYSEIIQVSAFNACLRGIGSADDYIFQQ